ncbi:hypothetical protein IJM86_05425 [bacterium]|nr:hypothetical protein [bacterium]
MATDIGKLTSLEHNLKNLDVSHITGAVQKELFDIVGGGAIDVDPYVLRAVENLENVSDVEQRIKNLRDDLKSKSEEEIPYSTPKKITNTKVELGDTTSTPPMVDLTNLDTKITEQKNALSDLSNIQQKIQQVKNRLEDNKGKCETLLGEYTKYSSKLDDLVTLENDISTHNRYKTLLEKCNTCITRISDIENAYHFNPTNWNSNVRLLNSII